VTMPPDLAQYLPATLDEAENAARINNPRVQEAIADLTAAREFTQEAKNELGPKVSLQGQARYGNDMDGFRGHTRDLLGRVVMKWNVFNGGIKEANIREQARRADEAHGRLFEVTRSAEEDVRSAWSRLTNQTRLTGELEQQARVSDDLLLSYREQFNVGRRSLLDVLDTQNTRYNVQAQRETARLGKLYAQYRVLAAENRLIEALGVIKPMEAWGTERAHYRINPIPPADLREESMPMPVMGPPAPNTGR
jgi:adhesin transport system outer membrane protein